MGAGGKEDKVLFCKLQVWGRSNCRPLQGRGVAPPVSGGNTYKEGMNRNNAVAEAPRRSAVRVVRKSSGPVRRGPGEACTPRLVGGKPQWLPRLQ